MGLRVCERMHHYYYYLVERMDECTDDSVQVPEKVYDLTI